MANQERRKTAAFKATDADGNVLELHEWTTFITTVTQRRGTVTRPAMVVIKLATGEHVTRLGKGAYRVASTGKRLRSTEPGAR